MPAYKLYYFPLRGRAEPIRLLFAAAGVEFEDVRITYSDWPDNKHKMPFRQMPVLEMDGKQLSQGYAILRYLANEYDLAGKDKWEVAEADQFAGGVEDLLMATARIYFEKDETRKAAALQKYKDETGATVLQAFETRLGTSTSGYLVGEGLTYPDLCFLNLLDFMEGMLKEDAKVLISNYPNVQKHRRKISELPKIAAWINKRPVSDF